jgi:hypothetical protein
MMLEDALVKLYEIDHNKVAIRNNQLSYLTGAERLLISKEASIGVAIQTTDYIVQGF